MLVTNYHLQKHVEAIIGSDCIMPKIARNENDDNENSTSVFPSKIPYKISFLNPSKIPFKISY